MRGLHFDLHGLSLSLEAADENLWDFMREQFEAEEGPNAEAVIGIRAAWRYGGEGERLALRSTPGGPGEERLGRGLSVARDADGEPRVLWTRVPDFPELEMAFRIDGERYSRLSVTANCTYVPRGLGRKLEYMRQGRADRKRNRLFFKLMYFLVYYPMAWMLERNRGWGLLHASAVVLPSGRTVVLSGLGGVGKSTLGLALLSRPGARLVSDNLMFHDEERIYACPEPVRLDAEALEGMGAGMAPERTGLPATAHPKPTYRVGPARRAVTGRPSALCFLRFAPKPDLIDVAPSRAAQMLSAVSDLAREIKDYRPCSALLTLLAAERGGPPPQPRADLECLLRGTPCSIVHIGEEESVSSTAERLARHVEALAS